MASGDSVTWLSRHPGHRYAKGLLRPDPVKLDRRLHAGLHPRLRVAGPPKGASSLTPCPRLDQGQTGTCHAHSASAAIWTERNASGNPLPFVPSPRLIASLTYADVRSATTPPGQPLPVLTDDGADLSDDASALARWGIAQMLGPSSDGRNSDVENDPADNAFPEPDASRVVIAGSALIVGEYQIPVNTMSPTLCAVSLDNDIPIWLGFAVDQAFENADGSTVIGAPTGDMGGHAVYLNAYRTAADGSFDFLLQNSWGDGWALNGAVWVSSAWVQACWTLWPMAVAS